MPGRVGGPCFACFSAFVCSCSAFGHGHHERFPFCDGVLSMWSFVLAIVDAYALLVGGRLQNSRVVNLFAVGDGASCRKAMLKSYVNAAFMLE